jgi:undecaprenyl-diphosphatase
MITLIILAMALGTAFIAFVLSATSKVDMVDPTQTEHAVAGSIRSHPKLRRFIAQRFDRTSAGGLLLTISFGLLFGVALVLGSLVDMVEGSQGLARFDKGVAEYGADHATGTGVRVVEAITQLGARWVTLAMLIAVATFEWLRSRKAEVFVFVAIVALGEMLLNNTIKVIVARERPSVLQVVNAHGYSFPSGHSSAAAAAWAAAALVLSRNRPRAVRAIIAGLAVLIAIAVATSRALLGVHWLTDVVGGLALGWGWFMLVAIAFGGRRQRLGEPVEEAVPEIKPENQPENQPGTQPGNQPTTKQMSESRR